MMIREEKIWNIGLAGALFSLSLWFSLLYTQKLPIEYFRFTIHLFGRFTLYLDSLIPCLLAILLCTQLSVLTHSKIEKIDALIISLPTSIFFAHIGLCEPVTTFNVAISFTLPIVSYLILTKMRFVRSTDPILTSNSNNIITIPITSAANVSLFMFSALALGGLKSITAVILFTFFLFCIYVRNKSNIILNIIWLLTLLLLSILFVDIFPEVYPIIQNTFSCTYLYS